MQTFSVLHSFRLSLNVPYVVFKLSFNLSVIHLDILWSSMQTFFFVGPSIRISLVVHWKFLSFIGQTFFGHLHFGHSFRLLLMILSNVSLSSFIQTFFHHFIPIFVHPSAMVLWSSMQTFFFVGPSIRISLVVHWKFLSQFIGQALFFDHLYFGNSFRLLLMILSDVFLSILHSNFLSSLVIPIFVHPSAMGHSYSVQTSFFSIIQYRSPNTAWKVMPQRNSLAVLKILVVLKNADNHFQVNLREISLN